MNKIPQLKEWISTLKANLEKDIRDYKLYLYLLNNEFIEAYIQSSKAKQQDYAFKIIYASKITELPPIFPLEEENLKVFGINTEKEQTIATMGEFANNVLVLKIIEEENIYCFYFLDENEELRQGYLKFFRENTEKEMINSLKSEGVKSFFDKYKIKSDNELFQPGYNFEIIIHNLEEVPEKNEKENEMKIGQNKIMSSIKNSIDEMKKSIITDKRRLAYTNFDDDITKIEKITTKRRKNSFSKGDKNKDDKKENVFQKIQGFFKKEIKVEPGIKGLRNVGATSYMNATLQCFSNSDKLKTELINIYDEYKKDAKANKKLTFALAEVIFNLWKVLDDKKYNPEDFKKIIGEMNPLFKKEEENNPKDLILLLLIKIHKETNIKKETNQIPYNIPIPNPYDFYSAYNNFKKYYFYNNNSIISNEFYGCTNSVIICSNCQNSFHNLQIMKILFFPLEDVKKYKNYTKKEVSIIECFEYYEKYNMCPSFYCNFCLNNGPAIAIRK